jgi:hypothetical protein
VLSHLHVAEPFILLESLLVLLFESICFFYHFLLYLTPQQFFVLNSLLLYPLNESLCFSKLDVLFGIPVPLFSLGQLDDKLRQESDLFFFHKRVVSVPIQGFPKFLGCGVVQVLLNESGAMHEYFLDISFQKVDSIGEEASHKFYNFGELSFGISDGIDHWHRRYCVHIEFIVARGGQRSYIFLVHSFCSSFVLKPGLFSFSWCILVLYYGFSYFYLRV